MLHHHPIIEIQQKIMQVFIVPFHLQQGNCGDNVARSTHMTDYIFIQDIVTLLIGVEKAAPFRFGDLSWFCC